MRDIDNSQDVLDIRDVIARIEELRELRTEAEDEALAGHMSCIFGGDEREELAQLESFVDDFKGYGGDEQWEGDWYPITLVRESYFKEYAQELAEELGDIKSDLCWPHTCIDWDKAARELRMDYTSGEFAGVTYWAR